MERQKKKRSYDKLHFPRKAATSTSTFPVSWLRSTCLRHLVYTYARINLQNYNIEENSDKNLKGNRFGIPSSTIRDV